MFPYHPRDHMKVNAKSIAVIALMTLSSCSTMSRQMASLKNISMPKIPKISAPKMPEVKKGDIARFSFSDLLPSRVPVVEVREQDLKKMQSGKEKALAYQQSQRGGFSSWFGFPVDFKEPALPNGGIDNPEFGLLPPKPE